MIPLIEQEIVGRRRWISSDEFSETLTLAQSAPGPISINSAVFVGYKMRGMTGVLATVLGTIIPSFTVIRSSLCFFPISKTMRWSDVFSAVYALLWLR